MTISLPRPCQHHDAGTLHSACPGIGPAERERHPGDRRDGNRARTRNWCSRARGDYLGNRYFGHRGDRAGLRVPAMPVLILAVIPASQVATAGGVNLLIRSIGATASSAVLGTLLGAMAKRVAGHGCPQMVPSPDALKLAFLVACGAAFGGAIVAGLSMTSPEARQIRSGTCPLRPPQIIASMRRKCSMITYRYDWQNVT